MMKKEIIADEFGPAYVVEVNSSKPRFKGMLIVDNLARGLGKGGIRMAENLTVFELFRLARTMTWKNSLFDLPFGGAKAGILVNPWKISPEEKKGIIQQFARLLKPFIPRYYVAGPDIGTGEKEMEWFSQALGNWQGATGKPREFCRQAGQKKICGLPHELGSTGFGVARATKVAADFAGLDLKKATVAIAGFGNVGSFAFKFLEEMGAKVVAVSDIEGTVFNPRGLSFEKMLVLKKKGLAIINYQKGRIIPRESIYELPVDILIPAAVSDVITEKNWQKVKTKVIIEGANIPIPEDIEEKLRQKGVLIVPDFVANSGGVISSFAEYKGYNPQKMFILVKGKIEKAVSQILKESREKKESPRKIALNLAQDKVRRAMALKKK